MKTGRLSLVAALLVSAARAAPGRSVAEIDQYLATPLVSPGSADEIKTKCDKSLGL